MSVAQLAAELGLTAGGVRQQLAQLESAGAVVHEAGAAGRGRFFYSLAPVSMAEEHAAYHRFVVRLLREIEGGQPGSLDRAVEELCTAPDPATLASNDVEERVAAVCRVLSENGFCAKAEPAEDGHVALLLQACPVEALAREFDLICEAEERCLARWFAGFEVRRDRWALSGASGCSYVVSASATA